KVVLSGGEPSPRRKSMFCGLGATALKPQNMLFLLFGVVGGKRKRLLRSPCNHTKGSRQCGILVVSYKEGREEKEKAVWISRNRSAVSFTSAIQHLSYPSALLIEIRSRWRAAKEPTWARWPGRDSLCHRASALLLLPMNA